MRSSVRSLSISLGLLVAAAACGSDALEGRSCATNQDCAYGELCVGGACLAAATGCTSDLTCAVGEACNLATGECEQVTAVACTTDVDCPATQRCNTVTGACIDGNRSCTDDTPCTPIGMVCDTTRSQCVECLFSDQCTAPATCVNGACVDPGTTSCRSDLECGPPSTVCQNASCVPGCNQPDTTLVCGTDEVCDATTGRCAPATSSCATDADCGAPAQICEMSACVPGCANGGTCGTGEVCNTNTGRCETVPGPCTMDSECNPPSMVCESGQCVGGCAEAGGIQCAITEMCNTSTGRCDPTSSTPGCTMDSECNPPSTICDLPTMTCAAGCAVTGCSTGETCNSTTGRCEASTPTPGPVGTVALNGSCSRNTDCQSGACFDFGGTVGALCVQSCASGSDCPSGFACADYRGSKSCLSAQFFQNASFTTAAGGSCYSGGDCQSGYCSSDTYQCVEVCAESSDCGAGGTCYWEEIVTDVFAGTCGGSPTGTGVTGSTCSVDADCASGVCYGSGICGDLCGSTADCPSASVCFPVNYSRCTSSIAGICFQWQVNQVKACVQAGSGTIGTGAIGSTCTADSQCRDGLCDTVDGVCTGVCSRDADCPGTMRCNIEQLATLDGEPVYFNVCKTP